MGRFPWRIRLFEYPAFKRSSGQGYPFEGLQVFRPSLSVLPNLPRAGAPHAGHAALASFTAMQRPYLRGLAPRRPRTPGQVHCRGWITVLPVQLMSTPLRRQTLRIPMSIKGPVPQNSGPVFGTRHIRSPLCGLLTFSPFTLPAATRTRGAPPRRTHGFIHPPHHTHPADSRARYPR